MTDAGSADQDVGSNIVYEEPPPMVAPVPDFYDQQPVFFQPILDASDIFEPLPQNLGMVSWTEMDAVPSWQPLSSEESHTNYHFEQL